MLWYWLKKVFSDCGCTGGRDYEGDDQWFELPESHYCLEFQLRIVDNSQPEPEEIFNICLTTENSLIHISTPCIPVHIVDNDSESSPFVILF